jgi:hypothetical protein
VEENMAYSRLFIILEQGEDEFAIGSNKAVGRCIIEFNGNTGRLFLQAQGLKSGTYRVCVLSKNSYADTAVPLVLNRFGRGELRRSLEADNINFGAKDILGVVVLSGEKTVLLGFTNGEYNWQACMMAKTNTQEEITETIEEKSEAVENVKADETPKEEISKTKEDVSESKAVLASKDKISVSKDKEEKDKQNIKNIVLEFDKKVEELREMGRTKTEDIIFGGKAVTPFGNDGVVWIKAGIREISAIDKLCSYSQNPFVVQSFKKYRHLLLGKTGDGFALGVPCVYDEKYSGSAEFKTTDDRELKNNTFCYCILKGKLK